MQLIYSAGSPFARKVRIALAEKGLQAESVTIEDYEAPVLMAANPIGQVPALVLDDGTALYDSSVICAWIDAHDSGPRLIPQGEAQWPVLRLQSAADAITGNIVRLRVEDMRPEALRWPSMVERVLRKTRHALDALEAQGDAGGFDLGEIALICALDYVDMRAPQLAWRSGRPNLLARWERLRERPSFVATRPQ